MKIYSIQNYLILTYQDIFKQKNTLKNVEDIIRSDFKFKKSIDSKAEKLISKFNLPISIHVRRGDYITNPNHDALDLNYYEKSINFLRMTVPLSYFLMIRLV